MGDSIFSKRIYTSCPITFPYRFTLVYFVEFDMLDFDVILKIDWLHGCFVSIYCRTGVVKFKFPKKSLKMSGDKSIPISQIIFV